MNFHQRSIVTGTPFQEIKSEHERRVRQQNPPQDDSARQAELERLFGKGTKQEVTDKVR